MKLINTVDNTELDAKKYPMPTKGTAGVAKINGEEVVTMSTSGRGNTYTYFRIKNVDLYVAGVLAADVEYTLELPENFGSETAPAPRKSYYIRKRPAKNADGSVPMGGQADGSEPTTGADGVARNPDGSTVSADAQAETLAAGNQPTEGAADEQAETNPDGSAVEPAEAPKARKRK